MMCRIYTHSGNTVVTKNVLVSSSPYGHWVSIIIRPCCSSYYTKSNFSRSKGLLTKIFTGTTMSVKKCTSWRLLLCNTLNRLKDLSSISWMYIVWHISDWSKYFYKTRVQVLSFSFIVYIFVKMSSIQLIINVVNKPINENLFQITFMVEIIVVTTIFQEM